MLEIKSAYYPVYLQQNEGEEKLLKDFIGQHSTLHVICDENTKRLCLPLYEQMFSEFNYQLHSIPAGEEFKNAQTLHKLYASLLETNADRNTLVINLGGGVVGDLGGFMAATYKRGVNFIQIPTTLLAMVDATIGGKLGYNFMGIKNSVGCFSNPLTVLINPIFLNTLPKNQLLSGWGEMLKHALIADNEHWKELFGFDIKSNHEIPVDYIQRSLQIKLEIVQADPKENGSRKLLNLGHTIGHAIESYFLEQKQTIPHGIAVALGILSEAYCANELNLLPNEDFEEIDNYIWSLYGEYLPGKIDYQFVLKTISNDKKNISGEFNFTFLRKIGKAEFNHSVDIEYIRELVNWLNNKL